MSPGKGFIRKRRGGGLRPTPDAVSKYAQHAPCLHTEPLPLPCPGCGVWPVRTGRLCWRGCRRGWAAPGWALTRGR